MEIGERLREQRKARQLSQAKLAEALHLSRQSISKWENGTALPSFANVVAISELFGISLDELIKGDAALMDHLKSNDHFFSPVGKLVTIGISVGLGALIVLTLLHVSIAHVGDWIALAELIGFIGLVCTIKWETLNKSLSNKAVFWGVIWLAALTIPMVMDIFRGIVEGLNSYN